MHHHDAGPRPGSRRAAVAARSLAALALAGTVALGGALPAQAHNQLVASTPADGEVLTALPETFSVTTNSNLLDLSGTGAGFALQVTDAAGAFYGDGCLTVAGPTLSTPAALGAPGPYRLVWQVISEDGHTVSGELAFEWAPTGDVEPAVALAAPPVCGETPPELVTPTPTPEPTTQAPDSASTLEPGATAPPRTDEGDLGPVLWVGGGVLVLLVAGAATVVILSRRNRTE